MNHHRHVYRKQTRKWRLPAILPPGDPELEDSVAYDAWRGDFGRARDGELGWNAFTRAVPVLLRFQRFKMQYLAMWRATWHPLKAPSHRLVRWRWRSSGHSRPATEPSYGFISSRLVSRAWQVLRVMFWPLRLLFVLGWGVVTGLFWLLTLLALNPAWFVTLTISTIPAYSILYFVDGILNIPSSMTNECEPIKWSLHSFGRAIYYAIVNLTSLGSTGSGPCGHFTGAIISAESLTGYFLLSLLAAMFFSWLTNR
jgi:hypothetical protein